MNIFNTKKVRDEWERKIEESYNQGKRDAINEALASIDISKEEKSQWSKLTEKELLVELMNSINIHNKKIDSLNSKIDYILNYKLIFKEINDKIKKLNECEQSLLKDIENSKEQVVKFEKNTELIITKVNCIDNTLNEIITLKSKLENMISEFQKIIPNLENACVQINDIASNMNESIEHYSNSPMEILNILKENVNSIQNEFNVINEKIENLDKYIDNNICYELRSDITFDLGSKLDSIKDDLESKLDDIKDSLESVESPLDQFGYNSLYSKLDDIEYKLNDTKTNY